MRLSDWSSDVCSSDHRATAARSAGEASKDSTSFGAPRRSGVTIRENSLGALAADPGTAKPPVPAPKSGARSEEHTSELQSLMRISYAVFCLKKKTIIT